MSYLLIADAGSTKTDWVMLDTLKGLWQKFHTVGINPVTSDTDSILNTLGEAASNPELSGVPDRIYFYGAGCSTPEVCRKMAELLHDSFRSKEILVNSDLLAAARSLLGREKGIACIIGTGSNSGLYDGKEIKAHIPSLGYILGDEGSGSALGKRLLADALKGILSPKIRSSLEKEYGMTLGSVLEHTYRLPSPNRYLASFVPFIKKHIDSEEVKRIVTQEFNRFFERNLKPYDVSSEMPICFTGGVAYAFADVLLETAKNWELKIRKISSEPMADLIQYHLDYE